MSRFENDEKLREEYKDPFKNKYLWLKAALLAYILEIVGFFLVFGKEFLIEGFYFIIIIFILPGILLGLFLNLFFGFKRAILVYLLSHVLVLAGWSLWRKIEQLNYQVNKKETYSMQSGYYESLLNYNLDSTALNTYDAVKMLYCSSGYNPNDEKEYLIQFVVLKYPSMDTMNILTFRSDNVHKEDGDVQFHFRKNSYSDLVSKNMEELKRLKLIYSSTDSINKHNGNELIPNKLMYVKIDEKMKSLLKTTYPTVIGDIY